MSLIGNMISISDKDDDALMTAMDASLQVQQYQATFASPENALDILKKYVADNLVVVNNCNDAGIQIST